MLAVTTRNKLRSPRFFLPMVRARRYVSGQLQNTPGLVRYASAIAGPTEFLTMTVWEDRHALFNFMSAGAHSSFMWMFTRWSESFWSMRWVPGGIEAGEWEGLSLSSLPHLQRARGMDEWRAELPQAPRLPKAEPRPPIMPGNVLRLPWPEPRPASALGRRLSDPSGSGACAITALVDTRSEPALGSYWRIRRELQALHAAMGASRLVRWSAGVAGSRRLFIVTIWRDAHEAVAELAGELRGRLGASWIMCWRAGEYEIGHWDDMRLRQLAARSHKTHMESEDAAPIESLAART